MHDCTTRTSSSSSGSQVVIVGAYISLSSTSSKKSTLIGRKAHEVSSVGDAGRTDGVERGGMRGWALGGAVMGGLDVPEGTYDNDYKVRW